MAHDSTIPSGPCQTLQIPANVTTGAFVLCIHIGVLSRVPLPRHSKKPFAGTRQRLAMNESRNVGRSATVSDLALNIGRLKAVSGLAQWGINPQRIIEPTRRPSVSVIVNTGVVGGMFQRGVYASVGILNSKPRNSTNSDEIGEQDRNGRTSINLAFD